MYRVILWGGYTFCKQFAVISESVIWTVDFYNMLNKKVR